MVQTTKAQRQSLFRKWCQADQSLTYRQFRKTVKPGFMGKYIMVHWCNMWLGIELDGYTHS